MADWSRMKKKTRFTLDAPSISHIAPPPEVVGIPSSPVKGSDTGKMKLRVGAGGGMAVKRVAEFFGGRLNRVCYAAADSRRKRGWWS